MINNLNEIINHSMAFIEDDYTELWIIVSKIQEENYKLDFAGLIEATKEIVRELVLNKNVLVVNTDTQQPMNLDLNEILKLVEDRFRIPGRMPNIGDGIWFTV